VGREEDVEHLVAATVERFGHIDLFVSNAGIAIDGGIETTTDQWQKIIGVDLMSEISSSKASTTPPRAGTRSPPSNWPTSSSTASAHPWVLEKFAIKGRDYEEYISTMRAGRAAETARTAAAA
jgi:NAD(P)-dependent dehydrogenase (short-subunit alcohol dehydrogenase family)